MKKYSVLVAAVVLTVLVAGSVRAQCTATKRETPSCGAASKGCGVEAAVAKLDLTAEQKAAVEAAGKNCATACAKAEKIGCSETAGKTRKTAYAEYVKQVKAVLTAEQLKAFEAALPTTSAAPTCAK